MQKKTLIILIETANRELEAKLLLSLRALKNNFRVVIGQKGNLWSIFNKFKPSIVMLKSFGPKNTRAIDFLKKNNFKIISNDEELILAWDMNERVQYRLNNENTIKLDKLMTVGDYDYEEINKVMPNISSRLIKTGNLRLELLKEKYKSLNEKDKNFIKNKYGDFILFATNFVRINIGLKFDYQIDFIYSRIVEHRIDPDSHHISLISKQINMQREILIQTLKFLDKFEKNPHGKKIVLSPHPVENFDFWKYLFKDRSYKNIILNDNINIPTTTLIDACDYMISSNSTSLLEAYFLKKKSINFLGLKPRPIEIDFLRQISNVVRSSDELENILINFKDLRFNEINDEMQKVLKNFNNRIDAFDELIKEIDKLEIDNHIDPFKDKISNLSLFFTNYFRIFKKLIKKILNINENSYYHKLHKRKIGDKLSEKFFLEKLNNINKIENIKNIKIRQLIPQVYLLDK